MLLLLQKCLLIFMIVSLVSSHNNRPYKLVNKNTSMLLDEPNVRFTSDIPNYLNNSDWTSHFKFKNLRGEQSTVENILSLVEYITDVFHDIGLIEKCNYKTDKLIHKQFVQTIEDMFLIHQNYRKKSWKFSHPVKELLSTLNKKINKCKKKDQKMINKFKTSTKSIFNKLNPEIIDHLGEQLTTSVTNMNDDSYFTTLCREVMFLKAADVRICQNEFEHIFQRLQQEEEHRSKRSTGNTNELIKRDGYSQHGNNHDGYSQNNYYAVSESHKDVGVESLIIGKLLGASAIGTLGMLGLLSYRILFLLSINAQPGDSGDNGITGERGMKGPTGIDGGKGAVGVKGFKGDNGDKGELGLKGFKGDKGGNGNPGIDNTVSAENLRGEAGVNGIDGVAGPKGVKGTAFKGEKGQKGCRNPNTPACKNGRRRRRATIGNNGIYLDNNTDEDEDLIEAVNRMWTERNYSNNCCSMVNTLRDGLLSDLDLDIIAMFSKTIGNLQTPKIYNDIKIGKRKGIDMTCVKTGESSCKVQFGKQ